MTLTMQNKLTARFRQEAVTAGLELVTAGSPEHTEGTWHVMDGLDTRLAIRYSFGHGRIGVVLSGQAMAAPDLDWFKPWNLYPRNAGSAGGRTVELTADYADGDNLRRIFLVVRDLLAPFPRSKPDAGKPHDEPGPGERREAKHTRYATGQEA